MESQKQLDELTLEELMELAKKPTTKKEFKNLANMTNNEIVGLFLKEKGFKPYRKKPIHSIILYDEYRQWSTSDSLMTKNQFIKAMCYWYVPVIKDGTRYFYTRYKGLRNLKTRIKALVNEQKKQQEQKSTEEE